jgi:hypothetical protein
MAEDTETSPAAAVAAHLAVVPYAAVPVGDTGLTTRAEPARDLTEAQLAEIVELLRVAFNGGPGWFDLPVEPIDHLRWKIVDRYDPALTLLTEQGSEIVGFNSRWVHPWLVRGQRYYGRSGAESALHPRFQGQGIANLQGESRGPWLTGDFSFSFTSHPRSLRRRERNGVQDLGDDLDSLMLPLSVSRLVRDPGIRRSGTSRTRIQMERGSGRRPRPWPARWLEWQRRILRERMRYRPLPGPRREWTLRTAGEFDGRVDGFFARAAEAFDLIQVREQGFLNWRYADPRAGGFTIRFAEDNGELLGYAVTRVTRRYAELADVLVLPGRLDVAQDLLRDAVETARAGGAFALRTWMLKRHPYYESVRRLGFVPVRGVVLPGFKARAMDPAALDFLRSPDARVHLVLGDSDHV